MCSKSPELGGDWRSIPMVCRSPHPHFSLITHRSSRLRRRTPVAGAVARQNSYIHQRITSTDPPSSSIRSTRIWRRTPDAGVAHLSHTRRRSSHTCRRRRTPVASVAHLSHTCRRLSQDNTHTSISALHKEHVHAIIQPVARRRRTVTNPSHFAHETFTSITVYALHGSTSSHCT